MRITFITLLIVLIWRAEVSAQSSVPFIAYWSVGDHYTYNITKTRSQVSQGKTNFDEKIQYKAEITVIDSTETSYTLRGIFENQILVGTRIPEEVLKRVEKYSTQEVIWVTTELGEFKYIENWEEISEQMEELNRELVMYNEENNNNEVRDIIQASAPLMALFESKEGIEQLVFSELMLIHFPFGYEFEIGKTQSYDEEVPNLLGGAPLRSEAKISVRNVDWEKKTCTLLQESKLNSADAKKFVQEVLTKSGIKDKELKDAMAKAKLDIRTTIHFDYTFDPGFPLKISSVRVSDISILSSEAQRTDATTIELIAE